MNESNKDCGQIFIADDQPSEGLQPRVGALDNPTMPVAPQLAPILMSRDLVIRASWNDGFNMPFDQQGPNLVTIIAAVGDQPLRLSQPRTTSANGNAVQGRFHQFHFRRGSRRHVYSERSTRAIGQYHKLCSLASFSFPDQRTPFFAVMNIPSIKHSSQRTFWRSLSWLRNARHKFNNTPLSAQACKRRWTVLLDPYWAGNSLHGAPVHRIHRMPSKHFRSLTAGRPPFRLTARLGKWGSIACHCLSVTCRQVITALLDLASYSFFTACQAVLG